MKDLVKQLQEELDQSNFVRIASIKITGVNGSQNYIRLQGTVKTFYLKQMAQEICLQKIKSEERQVTVRNEIIVKS